MPNPGLKINVNSSIVSKKQIISPHEVLLTDPKLFPKLSSIEALKEEIGKVGKEIDLHLDSPLNSPSSNTSYFSATQENLKPFSDPQAFSNSQIIKFKRLNLVQTHIQDIYQVDAETFVYSENKNIGEVNEKDFRTSEEIHLHVLLETYINLEKERKTLLDKATSNAIAAEPAKDQKSKVIKPKVVQQPELIKVKPREQKVALNNSNKKIVSGNVSELVANDLSATSPIDLTYSEVFDERTKIIDLQMLFLESSAKDIMDTIEKNRIKIRVSADEMKCWMRSTWAAILLQAKPNVIEKLVLDNISPNDPLAKNIRNIVQNTQKNPQSILKKDQVNDNFYNFKLKYEDSFKEVTRSIFLKNQVPEEKVLSVIDGEQLGNNYLMNNLARTFNINFAMVGQEQYGSYDLEKKEYIKSGDVLLKRIILTVPSSKNNSFNKNCDELFKYFKGDDAFYKALEKDSKSLNEIKNEIKNFIDKSCKNMVFVENTGIHFNVYLPKK